MAHEVERTLPLGSEWAASFDFEDASQLFEPLWVVGPDRVGFDRKDAALKVQYKGCAELLDQWPQVTFRRKLSASHLRFTFNRATPTVLTVGAQADTVEFIVQQLSTELAHRLQHDAESKRYIKHLARKAKSKEVCAAVTRAIAALIDVPRGQRNPGPSRAARADRSADAADAAETSPLATSRLRGQQLKLEVFNSDGMLTAAQVAQLLAGVSAARVTQMRQERKIFAVVHPYNGRSLRFPRWQFEEKVFAVLPRILAELATEADGWGIWHFFTSGAPLLRELTPVEVLRGQADSADRQARLDELAASFDVIERVIRSARRFASGDC